MTGTIASIQGNSVTIPTEPLGASSSQCPPQAIIPPAAIQEGNGKPPSATAVSLAGTRIAATRRGEATVMLACTGATEINTKTGNSGAPSVHTEPVTNVGLTGATLNGLVDPEGLATKYHFEYGTSESYGSSTPEASAGEGEEWKSESYAPSGLTAGTVYYYRIVATNSKGTRYGSSVRFRTTGGAPTLQPAGGTSHFPVALTTTGAKFKLVSKGGASLSCTGETGTGKLTSGKEGRLTMKLSGCTQGGEECSSTAKEGEVDTKELKTQLAYTYPADTAGLILSPASGEVFAEWTCPGGAVKSVVLKGSMIATVTPVERLTKTLSLQIKQKEYLQEPSEYETESGSHVAAGLTVSQEKGAAKKAAFEEEDPAISLTSEEAKIEE